MSSAAQQKSVTFLRNTGVERDVLRLLTEVRDAPLRRVFRQLAELGVPCSMTEELVGVRLEDWATFDDKARMKLQALWSLTEAYWDTARRMPGAAEGLDELILDAQRLGVYYDPPSCTAAAIEHRAYWAREVSKRRAVDLERLAPLYNVWLSDGDAEPTRHARLKPIQLIEPPAPARQAWAQSPEGLRERDPRGRHDKWKLDDSELLALYDSGGCVAAYARERGMSRQGLDYRLRRAVYARERALRRGLAGSSRV